MGSVNKQKGNIAEMKVAMECIQRGYKVALPFGDNWEVDLVVFRKGRLERVQVKYVESDGEKIQFVFTSPQRNYMYSKDNIDWMAIYDATTDQCYFLKMTQVKNGTKGFSVRLKSTKNRQMKYSRSFNELEKF